MKRGPRLIHRSPYAPRGILTRNHLLRVVGKPDHGTMKPRQVIPNLVSIGVDPAQRLRPVHAYTVGSVARFRLADLTFRNA